MAVETGTASGWLDLLDKLVTFAVANGWVVEKSVTVTAGQVEERYLRGPGSLDTAPVHVNIRTGATPVEGIYWWKVYGAIAFDTGFEIAGQPGASPGTNLILWQNNIDYWFYINDRRLIVIAKVAASYFSLYAGFFLPFANPIEYPYPLFIAATDDDPPRIYTTANSGFRSFADPGEDCAHIRTPGGQWVDVFNHGDYSTVDAYKNHEQGYYVWPYHSGGGNAGQEDSLIAWDIRPPPNYPDARIIIPLHFSGGVPEAGIIGIIDPFGYPYTDHRLYARISSGYGPGGFTGQPNVAAYDAIANDLTGPFTSYHFFSGPTVGPQYIHAVIETRAGFYVHIFFGEADTLTLGITPRPAYLAVSYYHWWAYSANPSARYEGQAGIGVHAFLFASSNTNNFQLYIGGADSQEPVKVGTQVLQIFRPFNTLGDYITSSGAGHFADAVHSLGLNPINGVTPFLPAPLLVEFPSNVEAFFPLGVVPD
jgi:hypothetical protein